MAPLPKGAAFEADDIPSKKSKSAQIADILRNPDRTRRMVDAVAKTGIGIPSEEQQSLADVPGMAKSAAMGLYNNAAYLPEEFAKTLTEPGQNPGWATEHPEVKADYLQAVENHPVANVAGAVAQPTPLGKGGAAANALGKLGGAAARTGYAGASGALSRYMAGDGTFADATKGAAIPALIQAGLEGVTHGAGKAAPALEEAAGTRAVQAAGTRAGITNALAKKGITTRDVPELGNKMLDDGLIPTGLNPFKNPVEQTADRARAAMGREGPAIGQKFRIADEVVANSQQSAAASPLQKYLSSGEQAAEDGTPVAQRMPPQPIDGFRAGEGQQAAESRMMTKGRPNWTAEAEDASTRARKSIDNIGKQEAMTPGSFVGHNAQKTDMQRNVDWDAQTKLAAELNRNAVSGYGANIKDQYGRVMGQDAQASLQGNMSRFGTAADASDLAENAISRGIQKQPFSLGKAMLGGAVGMGAGAHGGPEAMGVTGALGAAVPFITHAISERGPNLAAHADRIASKIAAGTSEAGLNEAPQALGTLADYLQPKDDEQRQKDGAAFFTSQTGGR